MKFNEAFQCLLGGKKIARPGWKGYWVMAKDIYSSTGKNTVHMHCKDGRVLDIRDTEDVFFTLANISAEDWEVRDVTES